MDKPGFYKGRPISDYVEEITALKRNKEFDKAEKLLLHLVDATEEESRATGMGVAPWYYGQLAAIYHSQMNYTAEVAILNRFAHQKHAPGSMPRQLLKRLEQVKLAAGSPSPLSKTVDDVANEVTAEFASWQKERVNKEDMEQGEPRANKQ